MSNSSQAWLRMRRHDWAAVQTSIKRQSGTIHASSRRTRLEQPRSQGRGFLKASLVEEERQIQLTDLHMLKAAFLAWP